MNRITRLVGAILIGAIAGADDHPPGSTWEPQTSGTKARFRGLSVGGRGVAWASGTGGTVTRTTDGGSHWSLRIVPGAESLDFRDVHGFDERSALVVASGAGPLSKVLGTTDGGETWTVRLANPDPAGFFDAIALADDRRGLLLADPIDGRFAIFRTDNAGATWTRGPTEGMPPALEGEGAFAASGTCLAVRGDSAWFGTGGGGVSRVFRSTDFGRTWAAGETPIPADNPSSGVFSIAFRDADHGVAVGGDYKIPGPTDRVVAATTIDGGRTWIAARSGPSGYRSAVAYLPGTSRLLAVGPGGADVSDDDGATWRRLPDPRGHHSAGFDPSLGGTKSASGLAVGDDGMISRFVAVIGRE